MTDTWDSSIAAGYAPDSKQTASPAGAAFSKRSLLDQVKAVCAETSALQTSRCMDAPTHVSTREKDIGTHATNTIRPFSQFFPHIPGNESLGGHTVHVKRIYSNDKNDF